MHIAEGMLPVGWALAYYGATGLFVAKGIKEYQEKSKEMPSIKQLTGVVTAAVFLISLMPIPVPLVSGSSSHPGGTALAAILLGPYLAAPISLVALLFQALFLSHGGLTTLGANTLTLGVLGGFTGFLVFRTARRLNLNIALAGGLAGFFGDIAIYLGTSAQLALALHGSKPLGAVFLTFFGAFMPTQLPVAVLEGLFTGMVLSYIARQRPDILVRMQVISPGDKAAAGGVLS